MSDIKVGEEIVATTLVFQPNDPVFNPETRPNLEEAIKLVIGRQLGYETPFASVSLEIHKNFPEQNLFRCLFGRDALLISDLLSVHRPQLLTSVVKALGSVQGVHDVPQSEEEFGRIAHEVREPNDPRAIHLRENGKWLFPYYGAVDATLIWINSVARISRSHPDFLKTVVVGEEVGIRAIAATKWMLKRLNTPSRLIESNRSNPMGIENQVWKDSGDSYMHNDGTLARGDSTASIETVAETFDALVSAAQIQDMYPSSKWPLSSSELLAKANEVRELLFQHMWLGDRFALGTERNANGEQVALDSQASNQARLLDSLILDGPDYDSYKEVIANALMDSGLLGATGLRTLSAKHVSYRAGGYHTGSAWPMDGVFAARGLLRQGFKAEAGEIATRIKSSIESIGGYPEFFRGDYPKYGVISDSIVDVVSDKFENKEQVNRINQPPQIIQGWTVGAYAWLSLHESLENGAKR